MSIFANMIWSLSQVDVFNGIATLIEKLHLSDSLIWSCLTHSREKSVFDYLRCRDCPVNHRLLTMAAQGHTRPRCHVYTSVNWCHLASWASACGRFFTISLAYLTIALDSCYLTEKDRVTLSSNLWTHKIKKKIDLVQFFVVYLIGKQHFK